MFPSSYKENGFVTLKEYVKDMHEGQRYIYFAAGNDMDAIQRMPQMEIFRAQNIEVFYFLDKVDEFMAQNLDEYDGKKLMSITRKDLDLENLIEDEARETDQMEKTKREEKKKKKEELYKELFAAMKKKLGEKVSEVRLSQRLTTSPVCLVAGGTGSTFNMEQLLKGANQIAPKATKIMELNEKHDIFAVLKDIFEKDKDSPKLKKYTELLYQQAMLIEGYQLENPVEFSNLISEMMVSAYKN
jgi:molecular chaperone HtpG